MILTEEDGIAYLDKFAVLDDAQGEGLGRAVWQVMREENPQLFWRSRHGNPVNHLLLRRVRRLLQAGALEGVLVRPGRLRHDRALRGALRHPRADPGGLNGMSMSKKSIGIVGARGHTGAELIRLVAAHPALELAFVSSRELDGQRVADACRRLPRRAALRRPGPTRQWPQLGADVVVLALPNGKAGAYVEAIDKAGVEPLIVDLSADYRFDERWYYGLPELTRDHVARPAPDQQPGLLRHRHAAVDRAAEGPAGGAAGVLRRVRLFRCRHHAVGQERPGQAARQPDAVCAHRAHAREGSQRAISACRWNSCRTWRRISAASPSPPTCTWRAS